MKSLQNSQTAPISRFDHLIAQPANSVKTLHVQKAQGCFLSMMDDKRYLDFISGVAVNNVGHSHPEVCFAVNDQMQKYAHTMVYGEHIQTPQLELAELITSKLPPSLQTVYFLCTGSEATDLSLKIAYKETGRTRMAAFNNAYHGDTFGAMSVYGRPDHRNLWKNQLPETDFLDFGSFDDLQKITSDTAGVIIEPVQGEAGLLYPPEGYLKAVRQRCDDTGALLIFDEVQTGIGRLGDWFAVNLFNITPDILNIGKALGGGLPLAAVITDHELMKRFNHTPEFSHITTFGGNPVCCASGIAALKIIEKENLLQNCNDANSLFHNHLTQLKTEFPHIISSVRGSGLMIGVEVFSGEIGREICHQAINAGLIIETTLFDARVIRISPPLTISADEIALGTGILRDVLAKLS